MSKAALKKEFAGMTREQIIQIVLDAYAARKEVREYFDFFIDPDVDKLMEKTIARIDKELMRGKHGRSTSRITLVRRAIKDFASFDPGAEYFARAAGADRNRSCMPSGISVNSTSCPSFGPCFFMCSMFSTPSAL